jgi:hypothetical protein
MYCLFRYKLQQIFLCYWHDFFRPVDVNITVLLLVSTKILMIVNVYMYTKIPVLCFKCLRFSFSFFFDMELFPLTINTFIYLLTSFNYNFVHLLNLNSLKLISTSIICPQKQCPSYQCVNLNTTSSFYGVSSSYITPTDGGNCGQEMVC